MVYIDCKRTKYKIPLTLTKRKSVGVGGNRSVLSRGPKFQIESIHLELATIVDRV